MSRLKYSRLVIPRKARDDGVLGIVALYGPLGFVEEGRDLVACFRDADAARRSDQARRHTDERHRDMLAPYSCAVRCTKQ